MAFKMKAGKEGPMKKNFPDAFKKTSSDQWGQNMQYGTSSKYLTDLPYEERRGYRAWKNEERRSGRRGSESDNSYEAYLASKNQDKGRKKGRGWEKVKDFFGNVRDRLRNTKGRGGTLPTTVAQRKVHEDFLNKGITGSATISDLKDRGHKMWNRFS